MKLFSNTINSLEQALDYSSAKQKVISHNIANIDTQNFKAKDISFKKELETSMKAITTSEKHFGFSSETVRKYTFTTKNGSSYLHNGNNVDIDKEMADLADNQIYFNALSDRISGKFNSLQTVIRGGK